MEESYKKFSEKIYKFAEINLFKINNQIEIINISKNIHNNFENIVNNNTDELINLYYEKIICKEKKIKDLLTYDLIYYQPEESDKISTLEEIKNLAINELKKYQQIVGGYFLEDDVWIVVDNINPSERLKIRDNQIALYNTCNIKLSNEPNQIWFIETFLKYIKKFIYNNSIKVKYDIFEDTNNNIAFVVIIFENK